MLVGLVVLMVLTLGGALWFSLRGDRSAAVGWVWLGAIPSGAFVAVLIDRALRGCA